MGFKIFKSVYVYYQRLNCLSTKIHEVWNFSCLSCFIYSQLLFFFLHTREIFRVLDLMKADIVNFTIDNLRLVLQSHGVEYERAQFQSILDKTPSECTIFSIAFSTVFFK